jgi:hypothetical protein
MRAYSRDSCEVGKWLIFMQAKQMLLLALKYVRIYARIYASGIQAKTLKATDETIFRFWSTNSINGQSIFCGSKYVKWIMKNF